MAKTPDIVTLEATSPEVLNAIREDASDAYQKAIPLANGTTESIRAIGQIMMQYQPLQNEFLMALVNRIGLVLITSRLYSNPWAMFKRGFLEMGETVEEIFVNLAKPHQFSPSVAEDQVFKREIPDVRSAFHTLNYQKFYKQTISHDQLKTAFLSWTGVTDLISRIINAMATSANYDEFLVMKYLLAVNILNGKIPVITTPAVATANMKEIAAKLRQAASDFTFLRTDYNMAGVSTHTPRDDQFLITNTKFEAIMDVEVLAAAFHMEKADFLGHRVLVDSFGNLDTTRLQQLVGNNPNYTPLTAAQISTLDAIPAVLVSRDFWMVFDNFQNMTQQYNGEGLYWNYWLHVWKTLSVSPFAQAVYFSGESGTITSVTVSPSAVTTGKGSEISFNAVVTGTGVYNPSVTWSVTGAAAADTQIGAGGILKISPAETATSLTVTATSVGNSAKTGTATVTVS